MKCKLIYLIISGIIIIFIGCSFNDSSVPSTLKPDEKGSFMDTRDGKIYETIKIGGQWIMAKNLAYKPANGNYWAYDNDMMKLFKVFHARKRVLWQMSLEVEPGYLFMKMETLNDLSWQRVS